MESWRRGAAAVLQQGRQQWRAVAAADGEERQLTSRDGNGVSRLQQRQTAASGSGGSGEGGLRAVGDAKDERAGGGTDIILCML
jgi:hypothetical protein